MMRRILFVGAPFGAFIHYIAPALEAKGASVWRTVSDGGEYFGTPAKNRLVFVPSDRHLETFDAEWDEFLQSSMTRHHISAVITFNDSCRRSKAAHRVAAKLGIPRFVLEEGYLRPCWITFDHEGVNGNSLLPKDPDFYLSQQPADVPHETFKQSFRFLVRDIVMHYAACVAMAPVLPYDPRYYGDSIWTQARGYVREYVWRKFHDETPILRSLQNLHRAGRRVFVALMQKPGDAQLRHHSKYQANNPYLEEVIGSFARHAAKDDVLVVKQHPLDYGIERSEALFDRLVAEHGLTGRACYVRKLTIESVLEVASGLVTINSTGGIAALQSSVPTISLGKAIYDMPRLTFQDGIDQFWTQATPPDAFVVNAFLGYLKSRTQVNGGYYSHRQLTLLTGQLTEKMLKGAIAPHATPGSLQHEPADQLAPIPAPLAVA
jgi:capsular polysaccharide export protein